MSTEMPQNPENPPPTETPVDVAPGAVAGAAPMTPSAAEGSPTPGSSRNLLIGAGAGAAVALLAVGAFAIGAAVADDDGRPGWAAMAHMRDQDRDRDGWGGMDMDDHMRGSGPLGGFGGMDDHMRGFGPLGGLGGMMGGSGMHGLAGAGALQHGEMVIQDASGDFVTVLMQQGEVTAVSESSITVESSDGVTTTYDVADETRGWSPDSDGDGTLSGIVTGDTVHVVAQDVGDGATAQAVLERPAGGDLEAS
jgi:hypothetical protein